MLVMARKLDRQRETNPVRVARKLRGYKNQTELAVAAGVSPKTVYLMEAGKGDDDDGPAREKVLMHLGLMDRPPTAEAYETPAPHDPPHVREVSRLVAAGQGREDYCEALTAFAVDRGEPDSVIAHLVRGKYEAPPNAGLAWWMARWADAPRG